MFPVKELKRSALTSLWFAFLTFPIMVVKVDPIERVVSWRWDNMFFIAFGSFVFSILAKVFIIQKERRASKKKQKTISEPLVQRIVREPRFLYPLALACFIFGISFPFLFSTYQTNIMTTALMYVVLGLGLNIVVGVAGLLDLGYVAFYAVGAYSYALLNYNFDMGFWTVLPIGGLLAALLGIILGFPVLRLRGDYLAIVTLGFGEIIRLVLENWNDFSQGPSGIANIPRPSFFGMDMTFAGGITYIYYIILVLVVLTIFVVNRLQNSRLGRAWLALREDEIACEAMGIDKTKTKLIAFSLGAFWAGFVGVIFAAKTTFVNPASFTFLESAIILSIVVLGGMGSIIGVVIGALILILLPEYLRALSEYRMLAFGAILVVMMVFKPGGIISNVRRNYKFKGLSVVEGKNNE